MITSGVYRYGVSWSEQLTGVSDMLRRVRQERQILFYREGREAVVSVAEPRNSNARLLALNGKTDASSDAQDVVTQKLCANGEREFGILPFNTDDHPVIAFAAPMNNVAATR